jgi:hypothetical protein
MRRLWPHRPSPALVIACIALFASLGGTGYAATQVHFGATSAKAKSKHKTTPKPLTTSQVNKLIATYVAAHHLGAVGPAGPQGPAGANGSNGSNGGEGKTGPQGPGAKQITGFQFEGAVKETIATIGPWTVALTCDAGPVTAIEIKGPGFISDTVTIGEVGKAGETFNNNGEIGGGTSATVGAKFQMNYRGFLTSGSTMEQIDLEMTTVKGLFFSTCSVTGDAIPAS